MIRKNGKNIFLGMIGLIIITVIILAGLWPLNFSPHNDVEWIRNKNGILFSGRGIVYSADPINGEKQPVFQNNSISIEIWLKPGTEPDRYVPQILSLYDGKDTEIFTFGQWKSYLEITRNRIINTKIIDPRNTISLRNALSAGKQQFITVSSGEEGTKIYIDGKIANLFPTYTLIDEDSRISGQIVLGNSPTGKHPWTGIIFGLAIYNRSLREGEVFQHYQTWLKHDYTSVAEYKGLDALFFFDNRKGTLALNHAGNQHHLLIPTTFHVLKKSILLIPGKNLQLHPSAIKDIIVNVIGFIPLGFALSLFLYNLKYFSWRHIFIISIIFGGGISLAVELIQVYLPMRNSDLTDLICNELGTIFGVFLCQISLIYLRLSNNRHSVFL
jgi:VanZ family protein